LTSTRRPSVAQQRLQRTEAERALGHPRHELLARRRVEQRRLALHQRPNPPLNLPPTGAAPIANANTCSYDGAVLYLRRRDTGPAEACAALEVVPTISALRERGRAAVERALRENESRWHSLSDDDRGRVEMIARAVISDLLHEPTLKLRQAGQRGSSSLYIQTVRELFGLTA
jgi:hypothetical protein